jgi:hypothetical protein
VIWLSMRRQIERQDHEVDQLRTDVTDLRDQRLEGVEKELATHKESDDARFKAASDARGRIHEQLDEIRTGYVSKADFVRESAAMANRLHEFTGAVLKLERVGERADMALQRSQDVLDQVISVKGDMRQLIGEMDQLRKGAP